MLKDIFWYVICFEDKFLRNKLIDLVYNCINENKYFFLMYYIVVFLNFYDFMFIVICLMFYLYIDMRDLWGLIVFFIVFVYGNENVLVVLIKYGFDIYY